MRDTWKWALVVLVAILLVGCDTDGTGDNPNYVPDSDLGYAEDTIVEDDTWESPDSEITSTEDSGSSEECIPTIPDGTLVMCWQASSACYITWNFDTCRVSCQKPNGVQPPVFNNMESPAPEYFGCVPIDEQPVTTSSQATLLSIQII